MKSNSVRTCRRSRTFYPRHRCHGFGSRLRTKQQILIDAVQVSAYRPHLQLKVSRLCSFHNIYTISMFHLLCSFGANLRTNNQRLVIIKHINISANEKNKSEIYSHVEVSKKWGYPNSWMVCSGKSIYKWMICEETSCQTHFQKHKD